MNTKRQTYGVVVDLLNDKVSKALAPRVTDVRNQAKARGYKDLTLTATKLYESAIEYVTLYGKKDGSNMPSIKGKRFHLLCTATGAIFLTYQYQHVDSDVRVCLDHGTPVNVFSPYKTPDMVKVTCVAQWYELLAEESAHNKDFYKSEEYMQWQQECRIELTAILNTPIPWLHKGWRLHTLLTNQFNGNIDALLTHAQGIIAMIEEKGEWDIELTESLVMNEKASTAFYVATKGINKGKRTFWCKSDPESVDYWYNYEVLPVNVLNKFIHLTYLDSIGYKPLKRIYTNGADMSGKELWFGTALEDMLRTTPLYVDPYQDHTDVEWTLLHDHNLISVLKGMSYEDAKYLLMHGQEQE